MKNSISIQIPSDIKYYSIVQNALFELSKSFDKKDIEMIDFSLKELINNSIKHAEASEINVQISCRNKSMQITVEDNGKGFDKENVKENGIELKNIQSRVDYLQASMDILSNSEGTSTTIEIDKT